MKFYECGRSMVEMLGVLAIIGVLSVGAIAGYSKAMMKYRLNKQAEAFNMLLANALQISPNINVPNTHTVQNNLLFKLNLIPDGIFYNKTDNSLTDVFKNSFSFYSTTRWPNYTWGILFRLQNTKASFDICVNLVQIGQNFSSELLYVKRQDVIYAEDSSITDYQEYILYGDKMCENNKCLKKLQIEDIYNICQQNKNFENTKFEMYFLW